MDLERCPKCGQGWSRGAEKCRNCGFVPIGAGLDKMPKKKKRRAGRYVEPGSARGLLLFTLVAGLGYGCFMYQPWQDDWELVRSWFGQGRHHSVVGEWEIVKTVAIAKSDAVIAGKRVNRGEVKFSPEGKVDMTLHKGKAESSASGKYLVAGTLLAMNDLTSTSGGAGSLPKSLKISLSWTGPDSVIATTPGEAIYMRRKPKASSLARLMEMGIKPNKAEVPGQMRGVIATMQSNVDANSSEN